MAWNRDRSGDRRGLGVALETDLGSVGAVGRALVHPKGCSMRECAKGSCTSRRPGSRQSPRVAAALDAIRNRRRILGEEVCPGDDAARNRTRGRKTSPGAVALRLLPPPDILLEE